MTLREELTETLDIDTILADFMMDLKSDTGLTPKEAKQVAKTNLLALIEKIEARHKEELEKLGKWVKNQLPFEGEIEGGLLPRKDLIAKLKSMRND